MMTMQHVAYTWRVAQRGGNLAKSASYNCLVCIARRYVQVDIYGGCGTMRCLRTEFDRCRTILNRDYKFYLSFENSNCDYYITEKFFENGLRSVSDVPVYTSKRVQYTIIVVYTFTKLNDRLEYLDEYGRNFRYWVLRN